MADEYSSACNGDVASSLPLKSLKNGRSYLDKRKCELDAV